MARAAISHGERINRDFVNRVCTEWSLLLRVQSTSYREILNAMFVEAQMWGESYHRFQVRVSENGHSLHKGDADREEGRGSHIPPTDSGDDEIGVSFSPAGPSSLIVFGCL